MGTATAPDRQLSIGDEAMRRLANANAIRQRRREQRQRFVELGPPAALRAAVVIVSHPEGWARSWMVFSLLVAIPGIGHAKAYRAMNASHIPDSLVLGQMNERQRHDLCLWLEKRAAGWRGTTQEADRG